MYTAIINRVPGEPPNVMADADLLVRTLTPGSRADVSGSWANEHALIVHAFDWSTAESKFETAPEVCRDTGRVIASWIRLDNRSKLCAQLKLSNQSLLSDPALVLAAHREWGAACVDKLEGDFCFLIYDPTRHVVFVAGDTFGTRPVFYCLTEKVFIVSTNFSTFVNSLKTGFSPSVRWAADRLRWYPNSSVATPFDEVVKLPPAHHLTITPGSTAGPVRYFEFDTDAPIADRRDQMWLDSYREQFHRAVDDRLRSCYAVGSESSGGLDSSSITARMVEHVWHGKENVHCFGLVEAPDEHEWVLKTAQHCKIPNSHITIRSDITFPKKSLSKATEAIGYPPEIDISLATSPFYEGCQRWGLRTLLSGYGGDEFVTNQAAFAFFEFLNNRQFGVFFQQFDRVSLRSLVGITLRVASGRMPDPYVSSVAAFTNYEDLLLRSEFLGDIQSVPHRLSKVQPPTRLGDFQLANPAFTDGMATRLAECSLVAKSYGVNMAWPLLDRRLVAHYLRTPTVEKRNRSVGRYLHRRATSETLPSDIVWKQSKQMGGEAVWLNGSENPCSRQWSDLPVIFKEVIDPDKFARISENVRNPVVIKSKNLHYLMRRVLNNIEHLSDWLDEF